MTVHYVWIVAHLIRPMIRQITKDHLAPLLKRFGFKKKGFVWNRERCDFVDVVTLQEASYNTDEEQDFTINLGIAVPEFLVIVWPDYNNSWPTEAECAVRVRLGDLMQNKPYGDAQDRWWSLLTTNSPTKTAEEICDALEYRGIPFLDSFYSFRAIADHLKQVKGWQSKNPLITLFRALAEWKSGDSSSSLNLLDGMHGSGWKTKASHVATLIRNAQ
jgi:hypothetical protein